MSAYGAILASGPRKVIVIAPPDDHGYAGEAMDLATGEIVALVPDEGETTWHALTSITFSERGRTVAVAPGDSICWKRG